MTNPKLSLDVASPPEVVRALHEAAQRFAADAGSLHSAGYVWERFARILDHAAYRCEQVLEQESRGGVWRERRGF